jgi:hypothetical protein
MGLFTALAIVGTAASFQQSARQARFQKEMLGKQEQQQRAQVQRQRRSTVRQGIMARARSANVAVGTGMAGSSAFLGGVSSLSSQVGANLGFGSMMSGLSQDITRLSGLASEAGGKAALFGEIGSLGMKLGGAENIMQGVNNRIKLNRIE